MAFKPKTGLIKDKTDKRDFKYTSLLGAPEVLSIKESDWNVGLDAFAALNLEPITQDQGQSSSCVAQGVKSYLRRWLFGLLNDDQEYSARYIYSQIHGPDGGAELRDGIKFVATLGDVPESTCSSYESGKAPSEEFMQKIALTDVLKSLAKKADQFNYRCIEGNTDSIELFAHAIKNFAGCLGGFVGTNQGWCRPVVRPPKVGEVKWGHAVDLCAFGRLDQEIDGMPLGTKCLFTKNSWGDRYVIKKGKWKGYQAIPESYFTATEDTAVGPIAGAFVYNSWVLVPDEVVPINVKIMEFLQKHEGKFVQLTEAGVDESGSIGLVVNGKVLVTSPERAGLLALTKMIRDGQGTGVNKAMWDALPKQDF